MKKILFIGAGFLQAFIIKKAKALGYETYVVDGDPNALGYKFADHYKVIDIVDSDKCLKYAKENNIDGVLTAATDFGVLTTSYIAKELGLNGINIESAKLIKNKYLVRKCLCENNVDDTKQAYLVDVESDLEDLSKGVVYPVMVKPCDGSGSRGASRVDKAEDFVIACKNALKESITQRAEIETFIVGDEYGVESFVENGNIHILAIMKKWMTEPPYYAELGHAIPSGLNKSLEEKIRYCVEKALIALKVDFGSVNMDLIVTDKGEVHIIDIGARMGGNLIGSHIIPFGTGIDYMANIIKATVGDEVDFTTIGGSAVATQLLALKPGVVKKLPDFDEIQRKYDVIIEQHIKIGDEISYYKTNRDGCGYVVACGNDVVACLKKAESAKRIIDEIIRR